MGCSQLLRFSWWMQRIRKQKQAGGDIGLLSREQCCHPSTVGVATQKDAAAHDFSQDLHSPTQSCLIRFLVPQRRSMRTSLSEWQIATQHGDLGGKRLGQRDQKWRIAIASGAVRQNDAVALLVSSAMQNATHSRLARDLVENEFRFPQFLPRSTRLKRYSPNPESPIQLTPSSPIFTHPFPFTTKVLACCSEIKLMEPCS